MANALDNNCTVLSAQRPRGYPDVLQDEGLRRVAIARRKKSKTNGDIIFQFADLAIAHDRAGTRAYRAGKTWSVHTGGVACQHDDIKRIKKSAYSTEVPPQCT
jgi:hypothetical protein